MAQKSKSRVQKSVQGVMDFNSNVYPIMGIKKGGLGFYFIMTKEII